MLSQIPLNLEKVKKEEMDKEILRTGIIAELDAINLYEQMAAMTQKEDIRKVLLNIAKEEKTHVGEFQTLLLQLDKEQLRELEEGKKEVEEITKKKMRLGEREEALKILLSIIKKFPKYEQIDYCYFLLGLLEYGSNQLSTSETTFKKVS